MPIRYYRTVLCLTCIEKGKAIDEMSIGRAQRQSVLYLKQDVYDAISLKTCVEKTTDDRCTEQDFHGAGNRSI